MLTNHSLAVFLVDTRVRAVSVAYDKTEDYAGKTIPRDVKTFKTFDESIAKGDFVVIPTGTRWGFTVGRVEEVDVRVNYSSPEEMRWIVNKIDKPQYDELMKQEQLLLGEVAKAQEKKARDELADQLKALKPDLSGLSLIGQTAGDPRTRGGGAEPEKRGGAQPARDPGFDYEADIF